MRDKIRIELSSENRLGWEPFYAVLDLPATAQQIKDARQKARITGREDMTYQEISFLGFDPLPDLEHLRLDTTTVEELNYLAQRLDALSDEQFIIYQALFDQRFGDVDSDELLSVKDLINMTYGLDSVMVASNIHNDEQLGQFVIENDLHPDVAAIPDNSLYLLDKRRIGELQRKNEGGVLWGGFYVVAGDYEIPEVYDGQNIRTAQPSQAEPSIEQRRLDNEIARTLEGYDFDKDALREKLYQRASLGYLQIGDEAYVEHKLKNTLEQHDTLDSFDSELTNKTVKLIKLAENGSVSIILINDQEIRKEQTDHANSNPSDAT